jgi:MoxR-like ATPase
MRDFVREVPVAPEVRNFAMRVVLATHPGSEHATERVRKYVRYGSSPRGAQTLMLAAKAAGMLDGRYHASFADVKAAVLPGLRHRIILNFEGEAEGVKADEVLQEILEKTPTV